MVNFLPCNGLILGGTNSGKTYYLVNQLREHFKNKFNYIVLVCATYSKNKAYQGFCNKDPGFIVIQPESSEIDDLNQILLDIEEVFTGYKTLVILDDVASSREVKKRSNQLVNMAFSARHSQISVFILSQDLMSISRPFRGNIGFITSFYTPNEKHQKSLFEEYGGSLSNEQKHEFLKILKEEKYAHICICLRHPFQSYVEIPSLNI